MEGAGKIYDFSRGSNSKSEVLYNLVWNIFFPHRAVDDDENLVSVS